MQKTTLQWQKWKLFLFQNGQGQEKRAKERKVIKRVFYWLSRKILLPIRTKRFNAKIPKKKPLNFLSQQENILKGFKVYLLMFRQMVLKTNLLRRFPHLTSMINQQICKTFFREYFRLTKVWNQWKLSQLTWWKFMRKYFESFHPVWQSDSFLSVEKVQHAIWQSILDFHALASVTDAHYKQAETVIKIYIANFYDCQYLSEC